MPVLLPKRLTASGTALIGRVGALASVPGGIAVLPGQRRAYRMRGNSPWWSDNFNRADETPIGGDYEDVGVVTCALVGNKITFPNSGFVLCHRKTALPSGDMIVSADVVALNGGAVGVMGRHDGNNYATASRYVVYVANQSEPTRGVYLCKYVAGVYGAIGFYAFSLGTSCSGRIALSMNGSAIKALWDDVELISATDTDIPNTNTYAGWHRYNTDDSGTLDNIATEAP